MLGKCSTEHITILHKVLTIERQRQIVDDKLYQKHSGLCLHFNFSTTAKFCYSHLTNKGTKAESVEQA